MTKRRGTQTTLDALPRYQAPQEMTSAEYLRKYRRGGGTSKRAKPKAVTTAPAETEAQIQRQILDWLLWKGFLAARTNAGKIETKDGDWVQLLPAGWSDLTGLLPVEFHGKRLGIFLAVEVKSATGDTRPEQDEHLARVAQMGGCAIVARSIDGVEQGILAYIEALYG